MQAAPPRARVSSMTAPSSRALALIGLGVQGGDAQRGDEAAEQQVVEQAVATVSVGRAWPSFSSGR
jgi:hypothetical protein